MSATVAKALALLELFTEQLPEIGLTDVARISGLDKATAYRLLSALEAHGHLEQHPQTRLYRLGPAVLHLARMREAAFPVARVVQPILESLAAASGETAHLSLLSAMRLTPIAVVESPKANRVSLSASETLPFHATASGLAVLAYSPVQLVERATAGKLKSFTRHTKAARAEVMQLVEAARRHGYATGDQSYEEDVYGIAAPVFGPGECAAGAIAVATPSYRLTREVKAAIIPSVMDAAVAATRALGSEPPSSYLKLCQRRAA